MKKLTNGVMQSANSARKEEVQAWEEEITACEHTLTLTQDVTAEVLPSGVLPVFLRTCSPKYTPCSTYNC